MDIAPTEIYTLSLHDALPIYLRRGPRLLRTVVVGGGVRPGLRQLRPDHLCRRTQQPRRCRRGQPRSEEHTSELQSRRDLVCRLLLEKKNTYKHDIICAKTEND